jgi:hypothetical protein
MKCLVGGILTRILARGYVTLWPCHIHFESILRQKKKKKNYGNSNIISPCKNIINLQTNSLKETKINPSKYYYNF